MALYNKFGYAQKCNCFLFQKALFYMFNLMNYQQKKVLKNKVCDIFGKQNKLAQSY